jgi:hypothetical protein
MRIPDMTEEQAIAGTLKWCNEIRASKGLEALVDLPKGHQKSPTSCPCGAATKAWVGSMTWRNIIGLSDPVTQTSYAYLPPAVQEFVALFDTGMLPQYDVEIP